MKKFTIPCNFGRKKAPFEVYIGKPLDDEHPLFYQNLWLWEERGGEIPADVMSSFKKLQALANKNGVSFEDLCVYALEAANEDKEKVAKNMQKDETNIKKETKKKHAEVLAGPKELESLFEEEFYLYFLVCENKQGKMCNAVLLIRKGSINLLKQVWQAEDLTIEKVLLTGHVESFMQGIKLPQNAYEELIERYQAKNNKTLLEALKRCTAIPL